MGYGGALIWTGLAKNLKNHFPGKKIIFIRKFDVKEFFLLKKNSDLEIYRNNPNIHLVTNSLKWFFYSFFTQKNECITIDMENPVYHYWVKDNEDVMTYRDDGHAIEIACKPFSLDTIELNTSLELEKKEESEAQAILDAHNLIEKKFICIEPNTKKTFTANKQWPVTSWQEFVNKLQKLLDTKKLPYSIVQVGSGDGVVLHGVINLSGKTRFRHLKYILSKSNLTVVNEGGIAHLSSCIKTPTIVICNPSLPKKLMAYPQHINIFPKNAVHACGLKKSCPVCEELLKSITPDVLISEASNIL